MNTIFALTAFLTVISYGTVTVYKTEDRYCDAHLRSLSARMPDADLTCIATSPRPQARPDTLASVRIAGAQ